MLIISKGKGSTKQRDSRKLTPAQRAESIWERNGGSNPKEMEKVQKELKQEEYIAKQSG